MKKARGIIFLTFLLSLAGCQQNYSIEMAKVPLGDKYRTFYEIFPGSYCDSDGNKIGDLNGITSKLDYLQDIGFNGIWLTPIFTSNSYHKYDVINYKEVDPSFGDMDDLKNLIDEAHSRDIAIILDLVVNHTSNQNQWFRTGIKNFKKGGGEYSDYYNFSLAQTSICNTKDASTGVYYEAKFNYDMPDLNLDSENVRNDIKDIMKYYLDLGIDGFRLDAVTSFYTGDVEKNAEFLKWINDTGKAINPNCYFVGEAWTGEGEIQRYYESGIDSFFAYDPDPLGKKLNSYIVRSFGDSYFDKMKSLESIVGETGIAAPFITNHDNARAANILASLKDDDTIKFGHGLMQMMSGTTFTYYGDEIGMTGYNPPDENVRTAMYWGDNGITCSNPSGTTKDEKIYGSVEDQLHDGNSILNYVRLANNLRNKYEAIRKGVAERLNENDNNRSFIAFKKSYENEEVYILMNFNKALNGTSSNVTFDLNSLNLNEYNCESLVVDQSNKVTINNDIITLPGQSITVIAEK